MRNSNGRILIGTILMILGGLFFLDNFNFFNFPFFYDFNLRHIIFSWHSIFIIIGLVMIVNHRDHFLGYIFIGIGLFGLLRHFVPFFFDLDFRDLWPIIILFVGLWLILKRNDRVSRYNHNFEHGTTSSQAEQQSSSTSELNDSIDDVSIFNTIKKAIHSQNFRGGKATSIFGSIKLDLTNAKLAPGENVLDITCIFGGVDIRVPQDWKVVVNVTSVFGGFDDKRFAGFNTQTSNNVLIIKGSAIFGGGDLLY
jgi:predicted membrane protein